MVANPFKFTFQAWPRPFWRQKFPFPSVPLERATDAELPGANLSGIHNSIMASSSKRPNTTRLPAALREELGIEAPQRPFQKLQYSSFNSQRAVQPRRTNGVIGRKDARKAQRHSKKEVRQNARQLMQDSGSKSKPQQSYSKISSAQDGVDRKGKARADPRSDNPETLVKGNDDHKSAARTGETPKLKRRHSKGSSSTALERMLERQNNPRDVAASTSAAKKVKRSKRTQAEKDEDDEIAWLEAMLGMGSNGKRKQGFRANVNEDSIQDEDGYDELLGELDRFHTGMYDSDEGRDSDQEQSDDDEDEEDDDEDEDDEDDAQEYDEDRSSDLESHDGSNGSLESGFGDTTDNESAERRIAPHFESSMVGNVSDGDDTAKPHIATTEADKSTAQSPLSSSGTRYIPPAARAAAAQSSQGSPNAEQQRLTRQLKGLLNRLGDNNLDSIVTSIEEIYSNNKRAEVSQALTQLMIRTIAARSTVQLTDTFVVVYASLVATLYRLIGIEFAAGFLQQAVDDLLKHYYELTGPAETGPEGLDEESKGKELSNLVSLICHLYNLQVVACPLIYDLIKLFLGQGRRADAASEVTEADVEVLLKIIKTCGSQLRQDDVTALKQVVELASERAAKSSSSSSRVRFMLETMETIKSSKGKRQNASQESPIAQIISNMRRYLTGVEKKRSVRSYGEPLRVVLKDLQDAETKGKWWLVGAAWKGHSDVIEDDGSNVAVAQGVTAPQTLSAVSKKSFNKAGGDDALAAQMDDLARKHGMNTPSRRLIFSTLLNPDAAGYVEAAQSLLELRLSDTQRREVIRVLLHCLGREQVYNPYYVLVGSRLALHDTGTRITMQFCLWDYLREIGEKQVGGKSVVSQREGSQGAFGHDEENAVNGAVSETKLWHLSRAYGWWIAKGCLDLSILRTVDFASMHSARAASGGQRKGVLFLQSLLLHLLLSTQTNNPSSLRPTGTEGDRRILEEVLIRGTRGHATLLQGLQIFFARHMGGKQIRRLIGGESKRSSQTSSALQDRALWACAIALDVFEAGISALGHF